MKYLVLTLAILVFSCQSKNTASSVIENYNVKVKTYNTIEYQVRRIDVFSKDDVWDKNGKVLIEKRENDTLFDMSFFTELDNLNKNYLYDNYRSFEIINKDATYKLARPYGFLGSPGGQLVSKVFFGLDSVYKSVHLKELKDTFELEYLFKNDTVYNIKNITKTINLDKETYLPIKMVISSVKLGEKSSTTLFFKNIIFNNTVQNNIEDYIEKFQKLEFIQNESTEEITYVGTIFDTEKLPNIKDDVLVNLSGEFPALISFWEYWCSPCIRSLPKLKTFQKTYKNKINVIGISTQSPEKVKQVLLNKNIDFLNLIGNDKLLQQYKINSFPTYFLVDKNGVIVKEYSSFSDAIEKDIKAL